MIYFWALVVIASPNLGQAESKQSDEIIVTGQAPSPTDSRDETASVTKIVTSESPRARTSVGLLLDTALGVRVRQDGGVGRRETLQLRGASGQQIAVFLDEIPLTSGRGGAFDLSTLPIAAAESLLLIRGAASAAYGSAAQGGILRLKTGLGDHSRNQISARIGSFGLYQVDATLSGRAAQTDGFISARYDRGDGDFEYLDINGIERIRTNNGHDRVGILGRGRWLGNRGQSVVLLVDSMWDRRGEPGSSQFPNDKATATEERLATAVSWNSTHWMSGQLHMGAVGDVSLRRYALTDPEPLYKPGSGKFAMFDYQTGLSMTTSWEGSDWYRPQLVLDGRFEQAQTQVADKQFGGRDESRMRAAATLSLGLFPWHTLTLQTIIRLDGRSGRSPIWVPKQGLSWAPTTWLTLVGNLGRTFRDPSFDELYFRSVGVSGNPNLQPEDGHGLDLGFRIKLGKYVPIQWEVMGFQQSYDRLIIFIPIDAYRIEASDEFGADIYGLETELTIGKKALWSSINYLLQDAQSRGSNPSPLPYRPDHRLTFGLGWSAGTIRPFTHWTLQSSMASDRFGLRTLPAYQKLDLGVRFLPFRGWTTAIEFRNVTDQRGAFDAVHRPIPSRAVFVEVRWQPSP